MLSAQRVQRAVQIQPGDNLKLWGIPKFERQAPRRNSRSNKRPFIQRPNSATVHDRICHGGHVMKQNRYYEVLENGIVSEQSVTQPKSGTPVYGNFKNTKSLHR